MIKLEAPSAEALTENPNRDQTESRRTLPAGLFLVAPALLCVWYIKQFAVNVVCADEWAFFPFLSEHLQGTLDWFKVFSFNYNDHRAFFPIMYLLSIAGPLHYNEIAIEFACLPFLLGTTYFILKMAHKRLSGGPVSYLILSVIAFFMLDLKQWDNLIINFSGSTVMPPFFFVATLFLLDRPIISLFQLALAAITGFVALFSSAPGLLAYPLGLVQIFSRDFLSSKTSLTARYRNSIIWCVGALLVLAYYFATSAALRSKFAGTLSPELFARNPLEYARFYLACLANPFAFDQSTGTVAGCLLSALLLISIFQFVRGKWQISQQSIVPILLTFFGLSVASMIFIGRAGLGIDSLLAPRYASMTNLGMVGLLLTFATLEGIRQRTRIIVMASLMVAMVYASLNGAATALVTGEVQRDARIKSACALINFENSPTQEIMHVCIFPSITACWAPFLKMQNFSVFSSDPTNLNGMSPTTTSPVFEIDPIKVQTPYAYMSEAPELKGEQEVHFKGYALDLTAHEPCNTVLIEVDGKKRFATAYGLMRPDVAQHYRRANYTRSGFELAIKPSAIGVGKHVIRLIMVTPDAKRYFRSLPVAELSIL